MDDGGDVDVDGVVVGLVHEQDGDGGGTHERLLEIGPVPGVEGQAVRGVGHAVGGDVPHALEPERIDGPHEQGDDRFRDALPKLPENVGQHLDGLDGAAHIRLDGVGVLARHFGELRFGLFLDIPLRPAEIDEEDHGERDGRHEAVQSIGTQPFPFFLIHKASPEEVCRL